MMPNITRGGQPYGLVSYLVGEGRANEHESPHVVAGEVDIFMQFSGRELDLSDVSALAEMLDESRRLMGTEVTRLKRSVDRQSGVLLETRVEADVWHCSLSLSAHEGQLSDEQWHAIATDFMDQMGFTPESGRSDTKWVAIRHGLSKNGNDHVHIAASLVRTDGTKVNVHNDFKRAQNIARELELKYGLAVTGDRAAGLGTRGVAPGAREAAAARGAAEPDAVKLARMVRAAAATSADEAEFVRRARRSGLLIRPRFARGTDDVVEGYAIALRPSEGQPVVWHGGGKLARDLTLQRLRADWPDTIETSQAAVDEWRAAYRGERPVAPGREIHEADPELWKSYTDDIRRLREQLRVVPIEDRATWARVAHDTAGVFAAWSQRVEATPGPLALVSAELARTGQLRAHQVRPRPTQMVSVGSTALLVAAATMKADSVMAQAIMLRELAKLAQALYEMILARGDARRAEQMSQLVQRQLALVASRMPAPVDPTLQSAAPALRELSRFQDGTARPSAPQTTEPRSPLRPPGQVPPGRTPDLDR